MTISNAIPQPRKAEKRKVKLKMAIQGPSGSGKTWGALALASNLWPDAKILVVDTENESASLYADSFGFDTIPLSPPFLSSRYAACIEAAVAGGYEVLVIDSITHQWDGDGGILRRKEELDQRPGSNSYTNWAKFTPEHTAFIESIKQAPIHIIATMRSKQDYVLEANDRGKQTPRKVGMAPIQRDGFNYEFSIVFDVQMDHKAAVDKNRTGLFGDSLVNLADKKTAKAIREWLDSGKDVPVQSPPEQQAAPVPTRVETKPPAPPQTAKPVAGVKTITQPQQSRFFAIANKSGATTEQIKALLHKCGYEHSKDISMVDYEAICGLFESGQWADKLGDSVVITDADLPDFTGEQAAS